MNKYYVTFGEKYRNEPHPQDMHPDGFAIILAPDEHIAREMAFIIFGRHWAFIYTQENFDFSLFPKGCLMTL